MDNWYKCNYHKSSNTWTIEESKTTFADTRPHFEHHYFSNGMPDSIYDMNIFIFDGYKNPTMTELLDDAKQALLMRMDITEKCFDRLLGREKTIDIRTSMTKMAYLIKRSSLDPKYPVEELF